MFAHAHEEADEDEEDEEGQDDEPDDEANDCVPADESRGISTHRVDLGYNT